MNEALGLALLLCGILLTGCHGSALDSIYPGSFGHIPRSYFGTVIDRDRSERRQMTQRSSAILP